MTYPRTKHDVNNITLAVVATLTLLGAALSVWNSYETRLSKVEQRLDDYFGKEAHK